MKCRKCHYVKDWQKRKAFFEDRMCDIYKCIECGSCFIPGYYIKKLGAK